MERGSGVMARASREKQPGSREIRRREETRRRKEDAERDNRAAGRGKK